MNKCVRLALACLTVVLSGCAGQAYLREGQSLMVEGRPEEGMARIQQAIEADPRNAEFRRALVLGRDQATSNLLARADQLLRAERWDESHQIYQRVLGLDPVNERAKAGLQACGRGVQSRQAMLEARRSLDNKDWSMAREALTKLLADDPGHVQGLAMKRELADFTAPKAPNDGFSEYFRKPISIEFKDVAIKQAFEAISRSSGLNFVFDKDVKTDSRTSIYLRNSTVEQALYFLLLSNQLEHQVMNGNTLMIYPNTPAKSKDYQELTVHTFQMAHADARSVAATVKTLLKGRDLVVDEKLNMLVVRDTPETIRAIEKIVALQDVPDPEVMLEVEILEVKRSKLLSLGIQWPGSLSFEPLDTTALTISELHRLNAGNVTVAGVGVTANAKKEDNDVSILANPRIRVINKEKAKILIGDKIPLVTTTTTTTGTTESITYMDVGLKLEVEPTIYRGNDVLIRVGLEVSTVADTKATKSGTQYTIGTRNANTVLRLRDGETQILAGLIRDEDRRTSTKVPGLGDLPVAGRLFGSTDDDGSKTEVILSITPRVLRNVPRAEPSVVDFRSGTESSLRERPQDLQVKEGKSVASVLTGGVSMATPVAASNTAPVPSQTGAQVVAQASPIAITAMQVAATPSIDPSPVTTAGKSTFVRPDDDGDDARDLNGGVALGWGGPNSVTQGREFTLTLSANTPTWVTTMPMVVGFDPALLELVRVESGGWLGGDGGTGPLRTNVSNGRLSLSGSAPAGGITGGGNIARITFKALATGAAAKVSVLKALPVGRRGALSLPSLPVHAVWIQ